MLRSSLLSVSRGLVYINTLGRTCLHELFIEYEQVTAWEARFSLPTNWRQIIIHYQPPSALDGSMGRRTSRRHYSLVKLQNSQLEGTIGRVADTAHTGSFTTRRSHLNLLWIHIVLSTPMIYKLCRFISRSKYGESQQLLESPLRLGGYDAMIQQILPGSAKLRTPGRWRER